MAKLEKKSKIETGKKATKAASVKNRTLVASKKKLSCGVKAKSITVTKVARKTSTSMKIAKSPTKNAKKSTVAKLVATKSVAAKKRAVKTTPPPKRAIAKIASAKAVDVKANIGKTAVARKTVVQKAAVQPPPKQVKETIQQAVARPVPSLERNPISSDDLRAMLLERRHGIMKNFDDEIVPGHESEKPVVVGDIADIAQKSSENELSFHLAEVESRELEQIDKALDKIDEGTYGVCEKCGESISPARLKALPFASKCIRCQEEEERSHY